MTLPARIRIGLFWYDVSICKVLHNNGHACLAKVDTTHRTLKMAHKGLKTDIENTIIHEVLHALAHQSGLTLDEDTVEKLANGLEATMRDNAELMAWITRER